MDASLLSETVTYQLTAVLIHKGPTAYSGHYMAHIRDRNSNTWYNFNDEEIEKIKGNKLQLAEDEQGDITSFSNWPLYVLILSTMANVSGAVVVEG